MFVTMIDWELPDYEKVRMSNRPLARRIISLLLKKGKPLTFSQILEGLNIPKRRKSTLSHNLSFLERYRVISKEGRGLFKLNYKTPLCFIADTPNTPYAYLGLLGVKGKWGTPETEVAIKALKQEKISPSKIIVFTTQKAIGSWDNAISPELEKEIEWRTINEETLSRIEVVEEIVRALTIELMRNYILIMDCTSGPRPAGIAYYKLASQYRIPLIYVYEPQKELIWLISKSMLRKEFERVIQA